jgi:hypothetical protein
MTKRFTKFAAAVAPAALLLAAGATPAAAKVLLMGDGGWEVSLDGSVNGFAVFSGADALGGGDASISHAGGIGAPAQQGSPDDSFRVRTGLLPAVWGMNVKAPTTGGLDMAARIGLYPNISNNGKNTFHNSADLDMREMFFTVDGSFGQVLVGKTLSQFQGKNILTDMTLFGVGAVGITTQGGGTTLGRIGYGYTYPQFNGRIQYTTPDMNGFKASAGIYDPAQIAGSGLLASETDTPRFEGEVSYAGAISGANLSAWVNGMWQDAKFTPNSTVVSGATTALATANGLTANGLNSTVTAWGFGGGLQVGVPVGPGTLTLMGSGYVGDALGLTFALDVDAVDGIGQERRDYGYIGQATYAFGQGTSIGFSYGESRADETDWDKILRVGSAAGPVAKSIAQIDSQSLYDGMIWHDINPNLRVVAEYGHQQVDWFDDASQDDDIFSVGAFFFW